MEISRVRHLYDGIAMDAIVKIRQLASGRFLYVQPTGFIPFGGGQGAEKTSSSLASDNGDPVAGHRYKIGIEIRF
jgi:hypothetical protein